MEEKVFAITNEKELPIIALEVHHFQFNNNNIYRDYCNAIGRQPGKVNKVTDIPFLPISFFKTHRVETTEFNAGLLFKSSGTTGITTSSHYVKDAALYRKSFRQGFEKFYGNINEYCIIGLLPSYLERGNSSLVYMVNDLVKKRCQNDIVFYLDEFENLDQTLKKLNASGQKTILIGVTYALLDFCEQYPQRRSSTIIV